MFWLKDIRDVDIVQCCVKCFIGAYAPNFWEATHDKSEGVVDVIVKQHSDAKAYYLCGLSAGCVWRLNTHVAFVHDPNSEIHIDNDRIKLDITNTRRINFWYYNGETELINLHDVLEEAEKLQIKRKIRTKYFYVTTFM